MFVLCRAVFFLSMVTFESRIYVTAAVRSKNSNVVEPRQMGEGWDFKLYPDYTLHTKNILLITEIADVHPQSGIPRVLF